jgi:hypothetical protein
MFTKDGTEVFRGEWEATRGKAKDKSGTKDSAPKDEGKQTTRQNR